MQIAVVGGGPAGISLAYFLRGSKHEVTVYEGLSTLGVKPCAWGVLSDIDKVIDVSKESVISEIKGFRVYLDNKLLYEVGKKSKLGYIVDKPLFLKLLAEKVDVKFNAKVVTKNGKVFVNGEELKADKVIYATGHYSLPKEYTIPAIQYMTDYNIDPEIVEMYFYSDLLGYGWVFPERDGAKIGIGGYADVNFLKERLKTILKGRVKGFQGARVNDYGIVEERLNGDYVGEALGTVYAVTGEGIRPSIISSKIMAKSILEGKDFRKEFTSSQLYSSLKVHARVIAHAKRTNSVKGLERVLLKADPELVIKFSMGEFSKIDLLKLFGRMIF